MSSGKSEERESSFLERIAEKAKKLKEKQYENSRAGQIEKINEEARRKRKGG